MKKLYELVTVEENNENCVVLKVKENMSLELIKIGCFDGNETLFRLTKGYDHTCTVWKGQSSFSWHWGQSGHTLVSPEISEMACQISRAIVDDFKIKLQ